MSIQQMLLGASGASGYLMDKSLRFRASASAYLNRSFGTPTNNKKWTWSGWVKRGSLSGDQCLYGAGNNSNTVYAYAGTNASNNLDFYSYNGSTTFRLVTTAVFRDPSAWYHVVFVCDTDNATSSDRVQIWVNGVRVTAFTTATYPSLGAAVLFNDAAQVQTLGLVRTVTYNTYFDGYLADTYFVDGQALTPASFGETNALTGVWQPKAYTGTYGTNGFYLDFETTTSVAALGTDKSGNGNNWTVNNVSLTAGVTYDSMTDVPTLTSATAANYAVLNPLNSYAGLVQGGNLNAVNGSANWQMAVGSIYQSSGKWYAEMTCTNAPTNVIAGIVGDSINGLASTYPGALTPSYGYNSNGNKYFNGSFAAYGATYTNGDVIGIALDLDAGTLTFYKNNVSQGSAATGLSGSFAFAFGCYQGNVAVNFGQRPFSYTPPTGFVALNAFNLPTATILAGNTVMDATLWTGTGTGSAITISNLNFKPDFVWGKNRQSAYNHQLYDSVRGTGKGLVSNTTGAEVTNNANGYLSAFNSNGFSTVAGSSDNGFWNTTSQPYVAWAWQAGQGTTSSNTDGTITSTVSVNPTAGFSVVTYTGTGANATVGHGLGVAPKMIIVKQRNGTFTWRVYHASLANTQVLYLSAVDAATTETTAWNSTTPTSSVFSVGTSGGTNGSTNTYVAYCFADIDGFSKFGGYTGNGSTDGAFIYTGFRPRFVMVKQTNNVGNWLIWDTSRSTYNQMQLYLSPNNSSQELNNVVVSIDALSNGFKCRTSDNDINGSGDTYVYMAFAENPFKQSLAR